MTNPSIDVRRYTLQRAVRLNFIQIARVCLPAARQRT
jgi:hypothetical protein